MAHTGQNPEVEQVLGALSLLLNGGGVGQLQTITRELNRTLHGREGEARSVLHQIRSFSGQLDRHKHDIVHALEALDRLSGPLNRQRDTIDATLDELPGALQSINTQRHDLVRMLKALAHLSGVGTQVISLSKDATIDTLRQLSPVLSQLQASGDELRQRLQRRPDLPVRRRGRRPRPAGRPQPADGRLHEPRHQARPLARRPDGSLPIAADRPADAPTCRPACPRACRRPRSPRSSATWRSACRAATSPARRAGRCSATRRSCSG